MDVDCGFNAIRRHAIVSSLTYWKLLELNDLDYTFPFLHLLDLTFYISHLVFAVVKRGFRDLCILFTPYVFSLILPLNFNIFFLLRSNTSDLLYRLISQIERIAIVAELTEVAFRESVHVKETMIQNFLKIIPVWNS